MIGGGSGYLSDLRFAPLAVLENLLSYVKNWSDFWTTGFSEILRAVLFVGTFLLAVRGYLARARSTPGLAEAFGPELERATSATSWARRRVAGTRT